MTIIDFMRKKLMEYPKIGEFIGDGIHIDFTDPSPVNYGLSSNGDSLTKTDILGNQVRKHSFVLYAVGQSFNDYCRLSNSNFLLELGYWLERLPEEEGLTATIDGQELRGRFLSASGANAMAMQPMGDTMMDGVMYQIQIYANYKIESEE